MSIFQKSKTTVTTWIFNSKTCRLTFLTPVTITHVMFYKTSNNIFLKVDISLTCAATRPLICAMSASKTALCSSAIWHNNNITTDFQNYQYYTVNPLKFWMLYIHCNTILLVYFIHNSNALKANFICSAIVSDHSSQLSLFRGQCLLNIVWRPINYCKKH